MSTSVQEAFSALQNDITKAESKIVAKGGVISHTGTSFLETNIDSIPQGGGSNDHGYKTWTYVQENDDNANHILFVTNDNDVKEHYADTTASSLVYFLNGSTSLGGTALSFAMNTNIEIDTNGPKTGVTGITNTAGTGVNLTSPATTLKSSSTRTAILYATSAGNIGFKAYTNRIVKAGTYVVEFRW